MNNQILATIKQALNQDEQRIFELFYEPSFRGSWLYVSKEMVCHYIGYTDNKEWQTNFFRKVMSKWLTEDVDYRIVSRDDPIVTEYFRSDSNPTGLTAPKHVNGKNYYVITGDAFQSLCMMANTAKGRVTRTYYKRMADMAVALAFENALIASKNVEIAKENLLVQGARITELEKSNKDLIGTMVEQQCRVTKAMQEKLLEKIIKPQPREYFYMITNWEYSRKGLFKFSYATADVNARLATMNSGHTVDDSLVIIDRWITTDAGELKRRVFRMIERLLHSSNREWYSGSYMVFKRIIDEIQSHLDADDDNYDEACDLLVETIGVEDPLNGVDMAVMLKIHDDPVQQVLAKTKSLTWEDVRIALANYKGVKYLVKRPSKLFRLALAEWTVAYDRYKTTAGALVIV